ncbi:hypothetical protein LSAT2_006468 [Lamellibrachia satsuma]|nr:hypothetical protein LSAT2_006468 [Lamellibrachia satsuma]
MPIFPEGLLVPSYCTTVITIVLSLRCLHWRTNCHNSGATWWTENSEAIDLPSTGLPRYSVRMCNERGKLPRNHFSLTVKSSNQQRQWPTYLAAGIASRVSAVMSPIYRRPLLMSSHASDPCAARHGSTRTK